jgi:hypothetical protein
MESIYRIHRTKDQWLARSGEIWATWAIFNPNGPTLNCIGCIDSGELGVAEVFHRWLNPFREQAFGLGRIDTASKTFAADLAGVLRNAALQAPPRRQDDAGLFSCVPSMVTLADRHARFLFEGVFKLALQQREDDWGAEMAYLDRFGSKLFARASTDVRVFIEELEAAGDQDREVDEEFLKLLKLRYQNVLADAAEPPPYQPQPFNEAAFSRWIGTVSSPEFLVPALSQFAGAWVGSIDFLRSATKGDGDRGPDIAISFEDLREFLALYKHPLWPDEWTSNQLRDARGLPDAGSRDYQAVSA